MKVGGVPITAPPEEVLVLPRGENQLVFRATAIEWDDFNSACPEPTPPVVLGKGGEKIPNLKDETYRHQLEVHADRRVAYLAIRSLEPSDIEWDSVDRDDPKTWTKFEDDLLSAGLVPIEVNRIIQLCLDANQLDEGKLKVARRGFSTWSGGGVKRLVFAPNRTELFAIWRACQRFRILPPGVEPRWEDCNTMTQAHLLAFDQLQSHDESEFQMKLVGARTPTS